MPDNNIVPIILSAGESKRMGYPKILTIIKNKSFGEHIINSLKKAGYRKIYLVLGCDHELIIPYFKDYDEIEIVINKNFIDGPLSSLKCALKIIKNKAPIMLFPVDHPLVTPQTLIKISEESIKNPESIIIPFCNEKKGHPVIFGEPYFDSLLDAPLGIGARAVVRENRENIKLVKLFDTGILRNINTKSDIKNHALKEGN